MLNLIKNKETSFYQNKNIYSNRIHIRDKMDQTCSRISQNPANQVAKWPWVLNPPSIWEKILAAIAPYEGRALSPKSHSKLIIINPWLKVNDLT